MSAEPLQAPKQSFVNLAPGDPAPWFHQRSTANPRFAFDTAAGRYLVLCFFGSAAHPGARAALEAVEANARLFDDNKISFFGVSVDPDDEAQGRVRQALPGRRYFFDFDGAVGRLYGAIPREVEEIAGARVPLRQMWIVLDPTMRVIAAVPFAADGGDRGRLFAFLERLPPVASFAGTELQAPVLFLPNVFEPELCRRLIGLYEQHGGQETGFMREVNGKTVGVLDPGHKRRKDYDIVEEDVKQAVRARILRRVVPEIQKVHQFTATRMERYIVSCYAADDGGHFRAHRDNTTKGTAHRRFAVSVNLNSEFEGGEVSFPEIRAALLQAAAGWGCRVLLLAAPRRLEGDRRAALRLPALPLRRSGRQDPGAEPAIRRGRGLGIGPVVLASDLRGGASPQLAELDHLGICETVAPVDAARCERGPAVLADALGPGLARRGAGGLRREQDGQADKRHHPPQHRNLLG